MNDMRLRTGSILAYAAALGILHICGATPVEQSRAFRDQVMAIGCENDSVCRVTLSLQNNGARILRVTHIKSLREVSFSVQEEQGGDYAWLMLDRFTNDFRCCHCAIQGDDRILEFLNTAVDFECDKIPCYGMIENGEFSFGRI